MINLTCFSSSKPSFPDEADKPAMDAAKFLDIARDTIAERGKLRDNNKERSMSKCVSIFNAITGKSLTEAEGWYFMIALKLARSTSSNDIDSFIDLTAYSALLAECINSQ